VREILGKARSVKELLGVRKYGIDYYQREYKWQTKHVSELLDDLSGRFLADYKAEDERSAVESYGQYFLGSVIMSRKDILDYIVDGQQRLTTLTLLLIYLNNLQRDRDDRVKVDELVFSEKYGKKSFNLDVEERTRAMEALYNQEDFDEADQPESVVSIVQRYHDIETLFPQELTEEALPFFLDWLIENVHLVEITAFSDDDAYTIFETMNDRGLSLSPTDMLKGYLLANISDDSRRTEASKIWKTRLAPLKDLGKEEDADFLKAWLRSQFADSIRDRKKGAAPRDFDRLGTEFHRWIRENRERVGLSNSESYFRFIERDLGFYSRQYRRLREASLRLTEGLETVFYDALLEFTHQYHVLLSPLRPDDEGEVIDRKLRVTGSFLDILVARRIWNNRSIAYSTMQYAMFIVSRDIRGLDVDKLVTVLTEKLETEEETFSSNDRLAVNQINGRKIHHVLARLIDHIERRSGMAPRYFEYVTGTGTERYEVEHIWADKFSRHTDEFSHEADFQEYRNRIGDLLLLPKLFNASFGALPYEQKLEHYYGQNILAQSLHPNCYERNPGFLHFAQESGLPFRSHQEFKKADVDARQELYLRLAEEVWDPRRLELEAAR
jgi:uncharacterized protein with ParB-like and HNH nuclease domain